MKETVFISNNELNNLKLSLNAYLALLMINQGNIRYNISNEDIVELKNKGWVVEICEKDLKQSSLSDKANKYFSDSSLFEEFYNTFPHTVPIDFGGERPLRTVSLESNAGKVTKERWKRKFKGNVERQKKAIEVLKAEIEWRDYNNSLKYMHNIDTWINQNDFENYEYLINKNMTFNNSKDI